MIRGIKFVGIPVRDQDRALRFCWKGMHRFQKSGICVLRHGDKNTNA